MSAKGGITEGKSHKEGGISMVVKSTGQQVELEGGEGVINKRNMASEKKFEFEGKDMTICEIASEINSADGNGVQIDCDNVTGTKYKYAKGGKILNEEEEESFKEWMEDGNVHKFEDGYSTQDAQWRNRLKGLDELRKYFKKEFLSDSYAKGGEVEKIKFEEFLDGKLSYPQVGYDENGDVLVDIIYRHYLLEKPFTHKNARLIDYAPNDKIKYPIQIKQTIYNKLIESKYAKGGWLLINADTERIIQEYDTESEARQMSYEYDGDSFVMEKSELEKEKSRETYRPPAPLNPATYIGMERGGSIDVEKYNFNELRGKYVNLYSMGVELPTENQIVDITLTSPQFRYRDLTLKFDLGNAKIKFDDIEDFLHEEIVYVKTDKEEFGVQLIPNQFAKGGKTENNMKFEDYESASMSMGGYEDGAISSNPTEFAKGGGVDSQREYLEKRLWNERGYDYAYLNKLSVKELRSLYDTEFYYDEEFKQGGGVGNYEMYDEQLYLDNDLKDAILENDTLSTFIKERHFIRDKNGKLFMWIDWMDNDQFDKLANFLGYKYAKGGGVDDKIKIKGFPPISKQEAILMNEDFEENFNSNIERYTKHLNSVHNTKLKVMDVKEVIDFSKKFAKGGTTSYQGGGEVREKFLKVRQNLKNKNLDLWFLTNENIHTWYSGYNDMDKIKNSLKENKEYLDALILQKEFLNEVILEEKLSDMPLKKRLLRMKGFNQQINNIDKIINEISISTYQGGGVDGEKVFEAQEDGILGIYSGSDAYTIEISKGDRFATFGKKQDDGNWWLVKKINVKPISLMLENTFDYNQSKSNVPLEIWQDLVLTFPKGENSIYAEMKEVFAKGGGVSDNADNYYRISISENDKYIGEYPHPIESLMDAKTIFVQLANQYKRPQYLISVSRRPTSSSGYEKINVNEWYDYVEGFAKGGDVRDMSWYQDFKKQELKRGTEHEMEHIDTIKKFKKEGVSDKEVAKAIAKDHLDENDSYYIELEKMEENAKQVNDTLSEHEKHKNRKKNIKRFRLGGYMGYRGEMIYIKMKEDVTTDLFNLEGRFYSETTFKKDALIMMSFISNNGYSTKMEIMDTGVYAIIPNVAFELVGYDSTKYGKGGDVKPQFSSVDLSENDKEILSVLRTMNEENATHEQRELISNFRGKNVVNQLSKQVISKVYGLLFEWHNIENPIHNILIENVGAGNMASLLTNSLVKKIGIEFIKDNPYYLIEKKINSIVNSSMTFYDMSSYDLKSLDAIVKVYDKTNPLNDTLVQRLYQTDKKAVAVGVAEFTSETHLNEFKNSVGINMGAFALNQMFLAKSMNYFVVNEGITDEGKHTLIYGVTKY